MLLLYYCMLSLVEYLKESFSIPLEIKPIGKDLTIKVPLYLKANYALFEGRLAGRELIFAEAKEDIDLTPDRLEKQAQQLREILLVPVVFILNGLQPWERKRLIAKGVSFVQPGRQLYLPDLLIDLSDVRLSYQSLPPKTDKLSYPAQLAVLYHLQVGSLEDLLLLQVAKRLGYSSMTISRLVRELEQHELCRVEGTKEKYLRFPEQNIKKLWNKAEPLLSSPVRQVYYTEEIPPKSLLSYDSALAAYTMLSPGRQISYAVGKEDFRQYDESKLNDRYGAYRLEVWQYKPKLLTEDKNVDRLSLYLSMRGADDERVKIALDEMLKELPWY